MTEPRWLTVEEIRRLHALQIDEFGGIPGVRDAGLLESAVLRPRQRLPLRRVDICRRSRGDVRSRAERQSSFLDGNKRVAFHATCVCTVWRSKPQPRKQRK